MTHEQVGFSCPSCGGRMDTKDSRPANYRGDKSVRRRRHCRKCAFRVTTFEVIDRGQQDAEFKVAAMLDAAKRAVDGIQALIDMNEAIDKPPPITRREPPAFKTTNGATV